MKAIRAAKGDLIVPPASAATSGGAFTLATLTSGDRVLVIHMQASPIKCHRSNHVDAEDFPLDNPEKLHEILKWLVAA